MGSKEDNVNTLKTVKAFRYADDLVLLERIKKNKKLSKIASGYISEDPQSNIEEHYLKNAMPITKQVSPKYHSLFERVCSNLGFNFDNISPYLVSDPRVNAACIALGGDKYLIYLTSSLVQLMNDDEIAFVIGHEIGHAIFEHHKLPVHGILANDDRLKPQDTLQVLRWSRMAEISADRVGLIGCQNLEHAFGAKIVLSSGLASSNFVLEIDNYASSAASIIEQLIKNKSYEDIYSTHPFNPLRVNSLYLFHQSKELFNSFNFGSNKFDLEYISGEIRNLFNLMDGQNSEADNKDSEQETKVKEHKQNKNKLSLDISDEELLLLWASVLVSTKNSNLENDELECISTLFSSEEIFIILNRLNLQEDIYSYAKDKFEENLESFKKLPPPSRCGIVQKLVLVARSDGEITDYEKDTIEEICVSLDISQDFYKKILSYL